MILSYAFPHPNHPTALPQWRYRTLAVYAVDTETRQSLGLGWQAIPMVTYGTSDQDWERLDTALDNLPPPPPLEDEMLAVAVFQGDPQDYGSLEAAQQAWLDDPSWY